jgi:hypothetical protein
VLATAVSLLLCWRQVILLRYWQLKFDCYSVGDCSFTATVLATEVSLLWYWQLEFCWRCWRLEFYCCQVQNDSVEREPGTSTSTWTWPNEAN